MEQLAVLTSTRARPEDMLTFAALERRGIRAIVIGDQVVTATYPRPVNNLASATRAVRRGMPAIYLTESPDTAMAITGISHATGPHGLFNGAESEIADGTANYAGDVLRQ